uniref:ATP-dependent zinc metalloprotease FtsH n=1 Tax=Paulinella chromatophora TaxID=39717 RepID=B1X4V6_PAUCH|nr:cell division protein ftsH [Paulinella chromatophora]ACB42975.1 cell division protein ftsH [Paulinella chromatophora]
MNKRWRNRGLYVLLAVVVIAIATAFLDRPDSESTSRSLRYSELIEEIQDNQVSRILISSDRSTAQVIENDGQRAEVNLVPDKNFIKQLLDHKVDIAVQPSRQTGGWQQNLVGFIFPILLLGGLFLLVRRAQNGGNNPAMNFGKSKARVQMEPETQVTFSDVAGVEGAKIELEEVVDFLKNPDRFTSLGAKIPKGILLAGSPGTGKTLLAKAVAGEARVPFFSIAGSEFVEMFVGVGASRVRDLFEQARKSSPCIVFIDEIDAVGRQRSGGLGGGNDEREQTLNQLLTEMDGFENKAEIIILAATNRPDVLDAALLRPGRFDRQVTVDYPDASGRRQIIEVHARGKTLAKDVDLDKIARRTPGFTGADLANLLNEAAILAARNEFTEISMDVINEAIERVMAGPEKKNRVMSEKHKLLVAYHEAGHAIVGALMPDYDSVEKVSIVPRGNAGGLTFFTPSQERMESGLYSRSYLQNQMAVALGGRVAEEIVYGEDEVTTGASSDLQTVARLARQMVTNFGMSERVGPIALGRSQGGMFLGRGMGSNERDFSEDTAEVIDEEVSKLVSLAHKRATAILQDNIAVLKELASMLIENETVNTQEIQELLVRYDVRAAEYL